MPIPLLTDVSEHSEAYKRAVAEKFPQLLDSKIHGDSDSSDDSVAARAVISDARKLRKEKERRERDTIAKTLTLAKKD